MFVFVIQPVLWGIIPAAAAGNEIDTKAERSSDLLYVENVCC